MGAKTKKTRRKPVVPQTVSAHRVFSYTLLFFLLTSPIWVGLIVAPDAFDATMVKVAVFVIPAVAAALLWLVPFENHLLVGVAATLFILPLFLWPGISEYGYGKTMLALVMVSLLSILWGVSAWREGSWRIRLPWLVFPFLLLVLGSLVSLSAAINGRVVLQSLVLVIFFFQIFLLIVNVARDQRSIAVLLLSIVSSAALVALYGLLQYFGVLRGADESGGTQAMITTLGNRNFLGGFLMYLLFPAVLLVIRPPSRTLRVAGLVLITLLFGTAMMLEQTAVYLALCIAAGALLIGWVIFRPVAPLRKNRVWLIVLFAILAVTFFVEAPSSPLNSIIGLSASNRSWVSTMWLRNSGRVRELDWWVAAEMLSAHPLTGVGLGNYKLAFLSYKADFLATARGADYLSVLTPRAGQAHSDIIQVAAELGVFGILAVVGFLVLLTLSVWRRIRRNPDEHDRFDLLLLSAGLIAFLAHAMVDFPAHLPASVLAALTIGGILFSRAYGEQTLLTARLRGGWMKGTVVAVAVFSTVVAGFGVADLAANVLMAEGENQYRLGNEEQAVALLERSLALDFAPRQTYYVLATIQVQGGDYEDALTNYEKCLTRFVDENVFLIYADLSSTLGYLEQARATIEFLLSTNPLGTVSTQAQYVLAGVAVKQGRYMEASEILTALIDEAPKFELAYIAMGDLYLRRGLYADAREWYEQTLPILSNKLVDALSKLPNSARQLLVSELPPDLAAQYYDVLDEIEDVLAKALATRTVDRITVTSYGTLRQSIATLLNERAVIMNRLSQLE